MTNKSLKDLTPFYIRGGIRLDQPVSNKSFMNLVFTAARGSIACGCHACKKLEVILYPLLLRLVICPYGMI